MGRFDRLRIWLAVKLAGWLAGPVVSQRNRLARERERISERHLKKLIPNTELPLWRARYVEVCDRIEDCDHALGVLVGVCGKR